VTSDHDLRTVLRERFAAAPPLPDSVLREVSDRVPETPQHSVVPAHPTRGRFTSMSSAARFAIAGILGVAAGGLLFTAVLPTGPAQDSPPAAAAEEGSADPMATAWVTGEIQWASSCESATITTEGGVTRERGNRCEPRTVVSDDPRFSGTSVSTWNLDVHTAADGRQFSLPSLTEDIRGERGGWLCHASVGLYRGASFYHNPMQGTNLYTCTGDGDNAGLMAVITVDPESQKDEFEGLIFAGDLPPAPEVSAGE
jgi:hypothetical protein